MLEDRKAGVIVDVEQLKKSFGSGARRRQTPELTVTEFQQRVQIQKKALLATGKNEVFSMAESR